MTDLYADLELVRAATQDEIKAAYRRQAKEHHPDAGGDREAFERIQRAYDILSDPDERAYYDLTGGFRVKDSTTKQAIEMIGQMLETLLRTEDIPDDIQSLDVMTVLKDVRKEAYNQARLQSTMLDRRQRRLARLIGRFTAKIAGDDTFEKLLANRTAMLASEREQLNQTILILDKIGEILESFDFRKDNTDWHALNDWMYNNVVMKVTPA